MVGRDNLIELYRDYGYTVAVIKDRKVAQWRDYLDPLRIFAALESRQFEADGSENPPAG